MLSNKEEATEEEATEEEATEEEEEEEHDSERETCTATLPSLPKVHMAIFAAVHSFFNISMRAR